MKIICSISLIDCIYTATKLTCDLSKAAAEVGADGVLVMSPFYFKTRMTVRNIILIHNTREDFFFLLNFVIINIILYIPNVFKEIKKIKYTPKLKYRVQCDQQLKRFHVE